MATKELLILLSCGLFVSEAMPRFYGAGMGQSQACGDQLADLMNLVCSRRGYNLAFRSHSHGRRVRRGIVEECCRKSCSPAMLELYCLPDTSETTSNTQIRKRSDGGETISEEVQPAATEPSTREADTDTDAQNTIPREGKLSSKIIDLLQKKTINETTEKDHRQVRHHKNHQHNSRHPRGHKTATKTKNTSEEVSRSFLIGTVKPYFAGRVLATYRHHYSHHS